MITKSYMMYPSENLLLHRQMMPCLLHPDVFPNGLEHMYP
jgi:hypothetical protein